MKRSFFDRYALLILMLTFFLVPFAFRGARMAVRTMRNDVRDWLPESFAETKELEWFRDNFATESFVMVSWEGCRGTSDDQRFRLFLDKFFPETPPSQRSAKVGQDDPPADAHVDTELGLYTRNFTVDLSAARREFPGNAFGLYATGDEYGKYENWGGLQEKWLRGVGRKWYYLLPNGDLYQWQDTDSILDRLVQGVQGWLEGGIELKGTRVASLGHVDGPWYYQDPRRLEADLFRSVVTGPSLLSDLHREGGALEGNRAAAMKRLRGLVFGPAEDQTCLLITLTDFGRENLHRVAGRGMLARPRGKLLVMAEEAGLAAAPSPSLVPPPFNLLSGEPKSTVAGPVLRIGGGVVDNIAIDEEGQATLVRLVGLSVLLGFAISWFSFRSIGVSLLLFLVGGTSAVASLALVYWSGGTMDAVLMSMPSLVYVLGISGAVHIVNYYRDTVKREGFPGRPGEALKLGWKPCVLASCTTAIGLASLATSNIVPIRKFGFFSAIAVVAALTMVFFFLPAGLQYWPPRSFHREPRADGTHRLSDAVSRFWRGIGLTIIRRHGIVTVGCLLLFAFCALGLFRLNTSVQLMNMFEADSKIIQDYRWLETSLGKLVPMELVVRVDPAMIRRADLDTDDNTITTADGDTNEKFRLSFLERVELVDNVRKAIQARFGSRGGELVGQAMSASSFIPPLPGTGGSTLRAGVRGGFSRRLATYRNDILNSGYFGIEATDDAELWRLSLRVAALSNVDYGAFVGDLKSSVEPVMAAYRCREEVLRLIDSRSEEGGFRGAQVLLLGVPLGRSRLAREVDEEADGITDMDSEQEEIAAEQWAIFSHMLQPLLRNAALKVRDWHDPRFELPADLSQRISNYDCVVLVRPDERYTELLKQVEPAQLIVADEFEFDPDSGQPIARTNNAPVSTAYTGLVPVVYKAQRTLLQSLVESTGWAFLAISIVMILLLRSPSAGMMSMIPNVFPIIVVFGCMGWMNVIIDIGTMMTASVAMGVAVDDTIHFLTWFRRGLDDGLERRRAIMLAYERCATAMTQTTMIAGLGLAVFGLSTFTPTQRFGILMLTLMTAALLGDLIFLPAMLAGPFGRVFSREKKQVPALPATHTTPHTKQVLGVSGNLGSRRNRRDPAHDQTRSP